MASYAALSVEVPNELTIVETARKQKLFQPLANELAVGDCVLSNMRLLVYSDGDYLLTFHATNAAHSFEPAQPLDVRRETGAAESVRAKRDAKRDETGVHPIPVRHHEFLVTARLYASPINPPATDIRHIEGVVITEIVADPFLVTAGEEVMKRFNGNKLQAREFNAVTHVEFELEVDPENLIRPAQKLVPVVKYPRHCGCPIR